MVHLGEGSDTFELKIEADSIDCGAGSDTYDS
jgi:hypothetical protein